jgi:sialidase-1
MILLTSYTSENRQKELAFLFKSGDDGYHTFRIPAMAVTNRGTVLAFAEGRKNTRSDTGDIDLVLKRSTDGGKTWSKLQVVWDDGDHVCGNPAPVVDRKTGAIFLLMTRNLGTDHERQIIDQTSTDTRRIFVTQSTDDGVTWTTPAEITKDVKRDNWTWYATGPCQGIQIVHGKYKGRLVIPCDHNEAEAKKQFSHVIYSDDHGKTWKLGGTTSVDQLDECTVAEIADGK